MLGCYGSCVAHVKRRSLSSNQDDMSIGAVQVIKALKEVELQVFRGALKCKAERRACAVESILRMSSKAVCYLDQSSVGLSQSDCP